MTSRQAIGLVVGALAAVAVAVLVIAPAMDDGSTGSSRTTTTAVGPGGGGLPLGTVQDTGQISRRCPDGFECSGFSVEACPAMPDALDGILAIERPAGTPTGVVVLLSGSGGTEWWDGNGGQPEARALFDDLLAAGVEIVQARWSSSWFESADGPATAACGPATLLQHVYDEEYAPLGLGRGDGVCGFCVSGNSAGGDQLSLSLSFYGLSSIIDVAVASGGPPHAGLARGCLAAPGDEELAYSPDRVAEVDRAFGDGADGPCARRDASFADTWNSNDAVFGGNDLTYDSTKVVVILGGADTTVAPAHGRIYVDELKAAGSPDVEIVEVPALPHAIALSAEGVAALRTALLGR